MAESPLEVRDVTDEARFVIDADGSTAELIYRSRADRLILVHTEVPDSMSGHGVGGTLVRAALDRARRDHLTIVPWCPFARRWLAEHPDETADVAIDWDTMPPPEEPPSS